MPKEIIDTTNKLIKPEDISKSDNDVIKQLSDNLQNISPEDINAMFDEMDEAKRGKEEKKNKWMLEQPKKEESWWNIEVILKNLKENHVKVEENKEILGYKWKIIHIDLPAVWKLHWYKFDCFISDESLKKDVFKQVDISEKVKSLEKGFKNGSYSMFEIWKLLEEAENSNEKANRLEKQSCSIGEIWDLLQAVKEFMKENGIDKEKYRCEDFLNNITGLRWKCYWLFDKKESTTRAQWNFRDGCDIRWIKYDFYDAKLLLRLYD